MGDTAVSLPMSSSPGPLADRSPSNLSSPLSDVEDKDGDPEEMDLDVPNHNSSSLSNVNVEENDDDASAGGSHSGSENDDSNLSDADINESEAETERLYDTPSKNVNIRNVPGTGPDRDKNQLARTRDRAFQPSPSKLKHQLLNARDAEKPEGDDDESLSDADDADDDDEGGEDDASEASSEPVERPTQAQSSFPDERGQGGDAAGKKPSDSLDVNQSSSSESRKRKRSPVADQSESDQPLTKRIGSVGTADRGRADDGALAEEDGEGISTNPQSGDQSGAEEDQTEAATDKDGRQDGQTTEGGKGGAVGPRKPKRNGVKKRKGSDDGNEDGDQNDEAADGTGVATAEEDGAAHVEDDHLEADVDEEAEAAHKNEEELERKKAALEQLQAIERHFTTFRDRLYEERLAQLNEEEATLNAETPTHTDFLAMMHCIDVRRDDKIRVVDLEYKFNLQTLKRWAVARSAQIHAQYFQSVRESREKVLEDLGRQWYQIQQQRRVHANAVPDYGLRFPDSKAQRTKDAIAYNKEVSILAGIAKYEGFPAAPQVKGASSAEMDEDFEEISRARRISQQQASVPPSLQELGGFSLGLGVAGQPYLADTPWANPSLPSPQVQQQQSHPEPRISSLFSVPADGRQSQPLAGQATSKTVSAISTSDRALNGDSPLLQLHQAPPAQENPRPLKAIPEPMAKLEHVLHS